MHGVSAFSSAVIGFPGFPFDLPFAFLGGRLGASLGFGALIAAATDALAGEALAGTAGVFAFGFSSFLLVQGGVPGNLCAVMWRVQGQEVGYSGGRWWQLC